MIYNIWKKELRKKSFQDNNTRKGWILSEDLDYFSKSATHRQMSYGHSSSHVWANEQLDK